MARRPSATTLLLCIVSPANFLVVSVFSIRGKLETEFKRLQCFWTFRENEEKRIFILSSGFGLTCHLGVLADLPTIGIGKNLHHVDGLTRSKVRHMLEAKEDSSKDIFTLIGASGSALGAEVLEKSRHSNSCGPFDQGTDIPDDAPPEQFDPTS